MRKGDKESFLEETTIGAEKHDGKPAYFSRRPVKGREGRRDYSDETSAAVMAK
jgi:hypothetical protein